MNKTLLRLYESDIAKELLVLSYLSKCEDPVSVKNICQKLNLTAVSVQKYIERIQSAIDTLAVPEISLHVEEDRIRFDAQKMSHYYYLRNHLIHSSISVQLGVSLLLGEKIHREQFIMETFISNATLKRRVGELKRIFLKYGLSLTSRNGLLALEGEETQIRKLAYDALADLYKDGRWPFDTISEPLAVQQIESYLGIKETPDTKDLFRKATLDLGIMILRLRNTRDLPKPSITDPVLRELMIGLIPENQPISGIPEDASLFFIMTLLTDEKFYLTPKGQQALFLLQKGKTALHELVVFALQKFQNEFELDSLEKQDGIWSYLYSIHFEKLFYPLWKGSLHTKNMSMPYPMLNRKVIQFVLDLRQAFPTLTVGPLYSLIKQYTVLYGRFRDFSFYELPIYVYVADDNHPVQSELLTKILQQMFAYKYKIKISTQEVADLIIITTNAAPCPRIAKQEGTEVRSYYVNFSDPFQSFSRFDQVFQAISSEKILAYNDEKVAAALEQ